MHTYLTIAWLVLPVLVFLAFRCVGRRVHTALVAVVCVAAMFAGTYLLMQSVWSLDAYLLEEVDKYEPGTPEERQASEAWASDTTRSFTFLFSPVLTGIWYTGLFVLLFGGRWLVANLFPAKSESIQENGEVGTANKPKDDRNPYRPIIR